MTTKNLQSDDKFWHHDKAQKLKSEAEREDGCPLCGFLWRGLLDSDPNNNFNNPVTTFLIMENDNTEISDLLVVCANPETLVQFDRRCLKVVPESHAHLALQIKLNGYNDLDFDPIWHLCLWSRFRMSADRGKSTSIGFSS
jgi:hypothetical protein